MDIDKIHTALYEAKLEIERLREKNSRMQEKLEVYETMRDLFRINVGYGSMSEDYLMNSLNKLIKECEEEIINIPKN